ncbi:MAG TPA: TnsA endonuclease C-terminal domain-containing protein [Pyrinomonadaceae bacterium]
MAKRQRGTTPQRIQKWTKQGRGQGTGATYKPWLTIQDVPSRGVVSRVKGWKHGRVHHLLSLHELNYFYTLEWDQEVTDIREQFPLPLNYTRKIAQKLGIRHPADPRTRHDVVMTTDFYMVVRRGGTTFGAARSVKPGHQLESKRVREKLEIERYFWTMRRTPVDWKVVTDLNISTGLSGNIKWVHGYRNLSDFCRLPPELVRDAVRVLTDRVRTENRPLRDITSGTDDRLGLDPGTSLALVRHLIANRQWAVDMCHPINPGQRLVLV